MGLFPGASQVAAGKKKAPDKHMELLGDAHKQLLKTYIYRQTQTTAGHGLHMLGASDDILSARQKF